MIEHQGIVTHVSGNKISVKILQQSACSSCHAKSACMAADSKEKIVDIVDYSGQYKMNDLVVIEGKKSVGYRAVWWAFVVPLIILVFTLFFAVSVWGWGETQAAVASVLALLPYYLVLYFFREKMADSFKFTIKTKN